MEFFCDNNQQISIALFLYLSGGPEKDLFFYLRMEIRLEMRLQPPGFLGLLEQMKNGLDVIGQRREMNGLTLRVVMAINRRC